MKRFNRCLAVPLMLVLVALAEAACAAPTIGSLVLSPVNVTAGQPVRLGAVVTPGAAPVASVTADISSLDPARNSPLPLPRDNDTGRYEATVIPTVSGERSVTIVATDTTGESASRTFSVTVLTGEPPIVLLKYAFSPAEVRPGQSVTASLAAVSSVGGTLSGTLDLSPLGLSASYPLSGIGSSLSATFTVPAGTPTNPKTIAATISDELGNTIQPTQILTVTSGPLVQGVTANPSFVEPGGALTLCATVEAGSAAVSSVTADLSPLGLSPAVPLANTGGNTWCATVTLPASAPRHNHTLTVTATDTAGQSGTGSVGVRVEFREPPVILSLAFSPQDIPPMGATNLVLQVEVNTCSITSVTADLSPIGGASEVALTSSNGNTYIRYIGTGNLAPKKYLVTVTVRDECGNVFKPVAALNVTLAPIIGTISIYPSPAVPGDTVKVAASVANGWGDGILSVTADLSAFGLSPLPLAWSTTGYIATFVVPENAVDRSYIIPITALGSEGRFTTKSGMLVVQTQTPTGALVGVAFNPPSAYAGETTTLAAGIGIEDKLIVQSVTADLSALGLPGSVLLERQGETVFRATVAIPAVTTPGTYRIRVKENGYNGTGLATLIVLPPRSRGDVNSDSAFNLADVALALRLSAGISSATSSQIPAGDVAGAGLDGLSPDGKLSLADAIALARAYAVGGSP